MTALQEAIGAFVETSALYARHAAVCPAAFASCCQCAANKIALDAAGARVTELVTASPEQRIAEILHEVRYGAAADSIMDQALTQWAETVCQWARSPL